jgi:hypothetical protein
MKKSTGLSMIPSWTHCAAILAIKNYYNASGENGGGVFRPASLIETWAYLEYPDLGEAGLNHS